MRKRNIFLSVGVAFLFFGCSLKDSNTLNNEVKESLNKEQAYRDANNNEHADYRKDAYQMSMKTIEVGFFKKPLGVAMREVSEMLEIGFDESFIPSDKYTLTIEHRGTLGDFLEQVKLSTGVSYKYRQNVLKIVNKTLIEESRSEKACKVGETPTVSISLDNVEPMQIFKYFSDVYGFNFNFNTRYYTLNANDGAKQKLRKTSLFYTGCDAKEALHSFMSSIDFIAEERGEGKFLIQDYKMENVSVPTYFDYSYTSGATLGESEGSSGGGAVVKIEESTKKEFLEYVKGYMSQNGIISISNRGYLTIIDTPKKVEEAKYIIQTEIAKQTPIQLSISIVRITMDNSLETGTNFNANLSRALDDVASGAAPAVDPVDPLLPAVATTEPSTIGAGAFTSNLTNGVAFKGGARGVELTFKALETMGDTNVVKEYNVKSRNGILSTFRAVDRIPYITTSVMASAASTEVVTEAKFATSGIILNIMPQLAENQETVNISTDILISEYTGDKVFNTSSGELILPQISENQLQVPVSLKMGESAILTGFNLKDSSNKRSGIPGLISNDFYFTERLFGNIADANKVAQLIVIITPTRIEDF